MKKAKPLSDSEKNQAEDQIVSESILFDYDTKEYPVETIVQKYSEGLADDINELYVPAYQRDFVWDEKRQSKFIESIMIGIPIPYIFTADRGERIEIVDGSQRIRCLAEFIQNKLTLIGLEKLSNLNGFKYQDLTPSRQKRFNRKSLRMILLSEKADVDITNDIFERLNTGSDILKKMEVRKGVYSGPFYEFIKECAKNEQFIKLCPISEKVRKREEGEEMILRFFAYSDRYLNFVHRVDEFLNEFIKDNKTSFDKKTLSREFKNVLDFVDRYFPYGFTKGVSFKTTPRVRFEALSVGTNLALKNKPNLVPGSFDWLESDEFKNHTRSDASNSRPKIKARIEYVRDRLLGKK